MRDLFLRACRLLGLFRFSRLLYRNRLTILCYHAFSQHDEHRFRPQMYMREEVFAARMALLARLGCHVLPLDEALARLRDKALPPRSVVITIDDGFCSVGAIALPVLRNHGFPATIYVTTYYVAHPTPVFRLLVQYMHWSAGVEYLDFDGLTPDRTGRFPLRSDAAKRALWQLIEHAETHLDEPARAALAGKLASRLGIELEALLRDRTFNIMDAEQIRRVCQNGFDVQLHTHRHRLPAEPALIEREIIDNRRILEPLAGHALSHLCYPSGVWHQSQWASLEKLGVRSATTCTPGLNSSDTPPLALRRLLDDDRWSLIRFEAEVCGFGELLRTIKRAIQYRRQGAIATAPDAA